MPDKTNGRAEVVVITGASAGVGRATSRAFAKQGAHIGLLARGQDGLEGARIDVEKAGGKALALPTDVADPEQVETAASNVEQQFGPIDIWVNNAMVTVFGEFMEISPDEFRRATEVTYFGAVNGTRSALKRMVPRNRGCIIQVGSALAYRSIPLQSPYCGAKHAIMGFTDSVRTELLHNGHNIQLTMVQMPALNTPQFGWCKTYLNRHPQPVPPIFEPEVAAEAIAWVAHHYRRELYVGSSTIAAIAGNKIAPAALDLYLACTGYESQQTDQPVSIDRPNNLFDPLPGDHGARGIFSEKAKPSSRQLWAEMHRGPLVAAGACLISAGLAFWLKNR